MDMNEAAAYLRICSVKFKELVKEVDIPYVQYAGMKKKLYHRKDLEKFIDDNKVKPVKFDIYDIPELDSHKKPGKTSLRNKNKGITKSVVQGWVRELNQKIKEKK